MPSSTGGLSATYTINPGQLLNIPFPVDSSLLDSVILSNYSPFICRVSCGEHQGFLSPWTVDTFKVGHAARIEVQADSTIAGGSKPVPVISQQIIAAFVRSEEYELHAATYTYPAPLISPDQTALAIFAQTQSGATAAGVATNTGALLPNPAGNRLNNGAAFLYDCQGMQGFSLSICDGYYVVNAGFYGWYLLDWFSDAGLTIPVGHNSYQVNTGVTSVIEGPVRGRYLRVFSLAGSDALVSVALSTYPKMRSAGDNSINPAGSATASKEDASSDGKFGLLLRIPSTLIGSGAATGIYRLPLVSTVITITAVSLNKLDALWRVAYGFGTDTGFYGYPLMTNTEAMSIPAPNAPMFMQFQNFNTSADSFVAIVTANV
jgi:hypothetical protein